MKNAGCRLCAIWEWGWWWHGIVAAASTLSLSGKAIEVMREVQDPTRLHGWRVQVCVLSWVCLLLETKSIWVVYRNFHPFVWSKYWWSCQLTKFMLTSVFFVAFSGSRHTRKCPYYPASRKNWNIGLCIENGIRIMHAIMINGRLYAMNDNDRHREMIWAAECK